ncbi:hypothetical protein I6M88_18580 [Citrobacter sedlakii]|uniref:Ankyrin repeat domain-containing protein n=1 Tax=Citrobacter sedlakii TaxID=67826 RepID=A0ABS0ZVZ3_9ENTR|nr:hypothetical protein [Citrobacter sedlakii]MBJ8382966.1 hypothetical protein [Citrobacter sedlakii]
MIAVYCAKISEPVAEALPGWVTSLFGAVVGAIVTGIIAFYLQRNSHRYALDLERKKNKAEFVNKFVRDRLFNFIDKEIDFLQLLAASSEVVYASDHGFEHRKSLATMQSLAELIEDKDIKMKFYKLTQIGVVMENNIVNCNGAGNLAQLHTAVKLGADIKIAISNIN